MKTNIMLRTVGVLTAVVFLFASEVNAAKTPSSASNSQFKFPNRVGFFVRKGVRADQAGDPIATYWAGSLAVATVYYYRTRGHTLEREYSSCKGEVKMVSPSARLVSDTTFTASGRNGKRAIFDIRTGPLALAGPAKSQLIIFPAGDRFLKFRVTYPVAHRERAEQEINVFLRSFPQPGS
ncbi:MAG TPA: hypothetical protein VJU77_03165 [Chthoniobacterales bacterium]|nr:hypothetical protein [Chthoniobacterales bacterium]